LAVEFIGIISPLFLLPARLFAGPHHAPTLEGQYVLKDIILVAAALDIAAGSFRGGRLVRGDLARRYPGARRQRSAARCGSAHTRVKPTLWAPAMKGVLA
jgi:hypothetical protein